ncbi:MAG TPA: hypothetical protein VFF30_05270 [Nitrososphaerales archaeon]|nr:hypothetical protein [Nitrososphaerales archaeon]
MNFVAGLNYTSAQSTNGAVIVVQVNDQNGVWYNGVAVQIWEQSGPLQAAGTTQNGEYASPGVPFDTNYVVIVSNGYSSQNETVYVGSSNVFVTLTLTRPAQPVLAVSGVTFQPSVVSPGTEFTATLTVTSSSSSSAYNAFISFNSTSSPSGISLSGTGSTIPIGNVQANSSRSFNVTFSVDPTAKTGSYIMRYRLNYTDISTTQYSSVGAITIPVTGTPARPNLVASSVSFSPSVVTPGINFVVRIDINNSGNEAAYGANLAIAPNSQVSLVGGTGVISLGTIQPHENVSVTFDMYSNPTAPTSAVPVKFAFTYSNQLGVLYNDSSVFSVPMTATPNLKVGQFSISNAPLTPGLSTFLSLTIANVGGDSAYNVAITLSGNPFLTGNSTNYLGAIANGTSSKASFFLSVSNNTQPGSYTFGVNVTYQDLAGRSYSSTSNYSVQIEPYAPPEVTVTNILLDPPVLTPGTSGSITVFVKNTGTTEAKNVIIHITGGNGIVSSSYFGLGTIEPGAAVTQVVGLNVGQNLKAGSYDLSFNVNYTDPTGKAFHSSGPFEVTVYQGTGLISTTDILAIGGVVVLALIGVGFLRKTGRL